MITLFDSYGRQVQMPREQWRTEILPDNLRRIWLQPDALAGMIIQSLEDDFVADVLEAARQLPGSAATRWRAAVTAGGPPRSRCMTMNQPRPLS